MSLRDVCRSGRFRQDQVTIFVSYGGSAWVGSKVLQFCFFVTFLIVWFLKIKLDSFFYFVVHSVYFGCMLFLLDLTLWRMLMLYFKNSTSELVESGQ